MGIVLAIGSVLMVWTAASVLWFVYQMMSLFNLGTSRKDTWVTYLLAGPVVVILSVARLFKRGKK
jgi:hypothetical protein